MTKEKTACFGTRQKSLSEVIKINNADAFLITHLPHIRCLTGFSGSAAYLLISRESSYVFFTDFRYEEQIKTELSECPNLEPIIIKSDYWESISEYLIKKKISTILYQSRKLTCHQLSQLKKRIPSIRTLPEEDACEDIALIKYEWEVKCISKAAEICDTLFVKLRSWYKNDATEKIIAAKLQYEAQLLGAEEMSFSSIIAGGQNSAIPHAKPTNRRLKRGDLMLSDYGVVCQGYCSDMTRTVCFEKADTKTSEIYHIVLEAQEKALALVKPGLSCTDLDLSARSIIDKAGYTRQFGHALGHGVGLEIHEEPRISKTSKELLQQGMIITIEPGIYIPGWGGVRIEDLVLVTETGFRRLSKSPKAFTEID